MHIAMGYYAGDRTPIVVNETPGEREGKRYSRPSLAPTGAGRDSRTPRAGRGDQNRVFCICLSDPQRLILGEMERQIGNVGMD